MYDNLVNYQLVTNTFCIHFFGIGNLKKKVLKYIHTNNLEHRSHYAMKNFEFYSLNHNIF